MTNNTLSTRPVWEPVEHNGREARRYPDGSIRDDKGRMIAKLPNSAPAITKETQPLMVQLRREKKRNAVMAAANAAVESAGLRRTYGDMAFIAAMAETAMMKATTPEDPKAIDAMRFLLQESGLADKDNEPQGGQVTHVMTLDNATRDLLQRIAQAQQTPPDVIDGVSADVPD